MKINLKLDNTGIREDVISRNYERALSILKEFREDKEAYTGWVNWPTQIPSELIQDMVIKAEDVREKCSLLVVVGIGGSYLGSAAVIEALGGPRAGYPEVVFAGNNLSGNYLSRVIDKVRTKETCVCVVSKSGETMETLIAFEALKQELYEQYGDAASERIFAITDPVKGLLREESKKKGYYTYEIPENIGGRYSAFTAGILFPLAVAGVDIKAFVKGAAHMVAGDYLEKEGIRYALARYELLEAGKDIEVFEFYDPSLRMIGEWCKQLFGESEGKEGKGLFPASLTLSADLHSMGQLLQEGHQIFFETVVNILNWDRDVVTERSLNEINQAAVQGVIAAHRKANVPIIVIEMYDCKEESLGQFFYFMMVTAGVTGKLMGIDPFNQPGVEAYKAEVKELLKER